MKITSKIALFFISLWLVSCGSSGPDIPDSAGDVYAKAVGLYDEEDYFEARKLFEVIKLQYPASQFADDAQYFIAEIYFSQEQYILASFNYNLLRRVYPSSPYNQKALYMAARCYYELSPPYDRDQEYTRKAIGSFNEFKYLYPDDSLAASVDTLVREMRGKLAQRELSTAELYMKLESPKAAAVYYDTVIENFSDTQFHQDAYNGKLEALIKMRKYDRALSLIDLYNRLFPEGNYNSLFDARKPEIKALKE